MTPRRTAATMVAAAVLVNLAFTGLGMAFDYPEVLKHPPADVLAAFRASQGVVSAWFLLLALGAALLAPVAIGVGRLCTARAMRFAVPVGVAAAVVQVIGLLRWPLLVPGWAAENNVDAFTTANQVLGNLVGETFGYLLTAAWTGLVLVALGAGSPVACSSRSAAPRPSSSLWGCFRRWSCRSSTSPTSSATCCGASGC